MKKTKKRTKRNPQDTTLRNLRVLKRRLAALEQRVIVLEVAVRPAPEYGGF